VQPKILGGFKMKKVLSLVLAVVMILGLTTVAFANVNASDRDYTSSWARNNIELRIALVNTGEDTQHSIVAGASVTDEWRHPQEVAYSKQDNGIDGRQWEFVPMGGGASFNSWVSGHSSARTAVSTLQFQVQYRDMRTAGTDSHPLIRPEGANANVRTHWITLTRDLASRWDVTVTLGGTSRVWRGVNLNRQSGNDNALRIRMDMLNSFTATGLVNARDTLRVAHGGTRGSAVSNFVYEIEMRHVRTDELTLEHREINAANEIFMDAAFGAKVLRIAEYIPRATVFLPGHLIVEANLFRRDYLLDVSTAIGGANQEIMDTYNFDDVVFFANSGLNSENARVRFDRPGPVMFVYGFAPGMGSDGTQMIELGRSNQPLPVANAYFFRETALPQAPSAPEPAPEPGPQPNNPQGGGSPAPAPNTNFNPGTGR
jgi:hypothetical protein